jgi:hypothetical protein
VSSAKKVASDKYQKIHHVAKTNVNERIVSKLKRCEMEKHVDMIKSIVIMLFFMLPIFLETWHLLPPMFSSTSMDRYSEIRIAGHRYAAGWLIGFFLRKSLSQRAK